MVNAYLAMDLLGYPAAHPDRVTAREALRALLVFDGESAYCQPCVSPVWDTALASLALQEEASARALQSVERALDWLVPLQLTDEPGDWRDRRPQLAGGGWPFQFRNDYYPDVDDTGAVGWALAQNARPNYRPAVLRAADWICGMQSRGGGFAAFDVDNTHYHLNEIPFADHGALLDPPTSDVSARCVVLLALAAGQRPACRGVLRDAIDFLRREQEPDGAWFGRWGTNYIYGTWSVLAALELAGIGPEDAAVRRGAEFLQRVQQPDGGWGESNGSYFDPTLRGRGVASTSFHTAWALLGLLAAGLVHGAGVRRGIDFLLRTQRPHGGWDDAEFTAPGFPRVFYLRYHGYRLYFPLWALARYRRLTSVPRPPAGT